MMDPVKAYLNLASQYRAKRGSFSYQGKLLPRTTVGDVKEIKKLILGNCAWAPVVNRWICQGWDTQDFVHTKLYNQELEAFLKVSPGWLDSNSSEFSDNALFWSTFRNYAIARSAAGAVPTQWQYAKEAVVEAAEEAASAAAAPFKAAASAAQWATNIVKWGTIAGGLYLLYTVMKPEKSR